MCAHSACLLQHSVGIMGVRSYLLYVCVRTYVQLCQVGYSYTCCYTCISFCGLCFQYYRICDVSVKLQYFVTGLLIAVGNELVIKLADFGMARHVRDKDCYRVGGKARLPVKWMAPESLLYGEFSEATDVW